MRCGISPPVAMLPLLAALAACGPIPLDAAERQCAGQAYDAVRPRGHLAFGLGTDGRRVSTGTSVGISVTSDYLRGRDPNEVYTSCVVRRSGGLYPTRPYYELTP